MRSKQPSEAGLGHPGFGPDLCGHPGDVGIAWRSGVAMLVEYAGMEVVRLGLMMFESRTFAGCC